MIEELRDIMARLRDPDRGCAWDREQNFATIAPYTIEEAYEVADAIARRDMAALRDELGDLQFQVVFHARMAEELGAFDLKDVLDAASAKMVRRHPHIFGNGDNPGWETLKADERAGGDDPSALAGVALALPALLRADKIQRRAARTGFDWPDANGPRAKIAEEIAEVEAASGAGELHAEIGDLLFSVVNWARHLGIEPEAALRDATAKFEARFRAMEAAADGGFATLPLAAKESLWEQAKATVAGTQIPDG